MEHVCFGAARDSFDALNQGRADICFLAVDPDREKTVVFTAPYAIIEGVFAVRGDSPITPSADVDRAGIRVGVKQGSAYDLSFPAHWITRPCCAAAKAQRCSWTKGWT